MKLKVVIISLSVLFFSYCNNATDKKEIKEKDTSTVSELNKSGGTASAPATNQEIINVEDINADQLASRTWDPPANQDWGKAKATNYQDTIIMKGSKVKAILQFTTLQLNDSNHIISKAVINLIQPNKKYLVTANLSDQMNMGSRNAFNTFIMADIRADLKRGQLSSLKLESASVTAYAKEGTVEHN